MNTLARWRLILGPAAESEGLPAPGAGAEKTADELLEFVFQELPEESQDGRRGGSQAPTFTVPEWVYRLRQLFGGKAKAVLEQELVRRRGIRAMLQEPRLLEQAEPNLELVKVLLNHRSLLNEHTRPLARRLIAQVVEELKRRLKMALEPTLAGAIRRDRHSPRPAFRNLDLSRTLRRNLQHYDAERQRLLVERVFYFPAERKRRPWHIVVVVDQSGSMTDSVVFSAIMAAIFAELPSLRTSLVAFASQVADLSDKVRDPVDVLMSAQLGGGTDIDRAMRYAAGLVREPRRTIVVLISDFEEGGDFHSLLKQTEMLADSGVTLIGLGALSYSGQPAYSPVNAKKLREAGMSILVCNPEELAENVARIIRG